MDSVPVRLLIKFFQDGAEYHSDNEDVAFVLEQLATFFEEDVPMGTPVKWTGKVLGL